MSQVITFKDGTRTELNVHAFGLKSDLKPFTVVMCKRDHQGNKTSEHFPPFASANPKAMEAAVLRSMSKKEKKQDIYATPDDEQPLSEWRNGK